MNARTSLKNKTPGKPRSTLSNINRVNVPVRPRRQSQANHRLTQKALPKRQGGWLDRPSQDRLLRQRSLSDAKQGNYLDAIAGLTVLIDRNPESATDYNNRGLVHYQCGHLELAIEDYDTAIRLNPRLASAYNNRANYHAALGDLAEAIADYETAIDLDPTNVRAWINQGITFRDLDMYSEAIENFDQALQIHEFIGHETAEARSIEAHIYAVRGRAHQLIGDWNYAIADYHRALERLSDDPSVKRLRSQVNSWLLSLTVI